MTADKLFCLASAVIALIVSSQASLADNFDLIFKPVDQVVIRRLTPAIEAKFAAGVKPMGYVRHRFVEVNGELLQRELRKSLRAFEDSQPEYNVPIPLFEDRSIAVSITKWLRGNSGVHMASGIVSASYTIDFSVSFYFTEERLSKVNIDTPTRWYRIESTSEPPYYVVFESEYVNAEM